MAKQADLAHLLVLLGQNIGVPTSKEEMLEQGKESYLVLQRNNGRYAIRNFNPSNCSYTYALGLGFHAFKGDECHTILTSFYSFQRYLSEL